MTADKNYCMSSFLTLRVIDDTEKCFSETCIPHYLPFPENRTAIQTSDALLEFLKKDIAEKTKGKKCALALSGGIDSAILLQLMPENTTAYTFKCVVPGVQVTDESQRAAEYLAYARPDMKHCIVPIYWEDMQEMSKLLMKRKGAPIHSIEVQIYKAALQAKADGAELFIFGETADCIYGGHSQLLSRDWTFGEFAERWSFVQPYQVLKQPELVLNVYKDYEKDGYIDVPRFLTIYESKCSLNSYQNACGLAEIELFAPYAHTIMEKPLDLERVRQGENKYLVREVFQKLYPDFEVPPKVPMPRPMNEWLKDWQGPAREEFWAHCTDHMTGDQKWLVWALESFLNMLEA